MANPNYGTETGEVQPALSKPPIYPSYRAPREIKSLDTVMDAYRRNEAGDAELFGKLFENRVVYDHAQKAWLLWDGQRWQRDSKNQITTLVHTTLAAQYERAAQSYKPTGSSNEDSSSDSDDLAKNLHSRADSLRAKARIDKVLKLATSSPTLGLAGDEWNTDPYLLGVANGVLDLRTATLRPARPDDFLQHHSPTQWKGLKRRAQRWEKFIDEVFEGDQEKIACLQRCLGYGLSGLNSEGIMLIFHGRGRNGKDTMLGTILEVIGDQASMVSANILVASSSSPGGASPDVYALRGLRIAIASETNDRDQMRSAQVKTLTGGSPISARALYANPITFTPQFLIILETNTLPDANSRDYALWKRLVTFPFGLSFVENPQKVFERLRDPKLQDTLIDEASGILAWLVQGYIDWQEQGIDLPPSLVREVETYRKSSDAIAIFLDECCELGDGLSVPAGDLYQAYRTHCEGSGEKPLTQASFGKRIGLDFEKTRISSGNVYHGISLRPPIVDDLS